MSDAVIGSRPRLRGPHTFDDKPEVPSCLLVERGSGDPVVTIAIPTFRRAKLLEEAVKSCIDQNFDRGFEVVIIDNDEQTRHTPSFVNEIPLREGVSLRYYVNEKNIGPFQNWNRGIRLARAPWVTVLNDDDLLSLDCLKLATQASEESDKMAALAMRKTYFENDTKAPPVHSKARVMAGRLFWRMIFLGRTTRRVRAGLHFWYTPIGNSAAFFFKRDAALNIGGFNPQEFPSSDYWFNARLCHRYEVRQHREVGAAVRVANIGRITDSTQIDQLIHGQYMREELVGKVVPRWYRFLIPMVAAEHLTGYRRFFGFQGEHRDVERSLGLSIPRHRRQIYIALRLLLRGY